MIIEDIYRYIPDDTRVNIVGSDGLECFNGFVGQMPEGHLFWTVGSLAIREDTLYIWIIGR